MSGKRTVKIGGADTYTLRSSTLIENYFPGPTGTNIRQDPELLIGKVDFGTFGNDSNLNGPGTIWQAIPDVSRFQNNQIFAVPRANPNKLFAEDTRQLATYQVEQLRNNPLSIFTVNPEGNIPGFDCDPEPDNFSTMKNKREADFKSFFENGLTVDQNSIFPEYVYPSNDPYLEMPNANATIVYNLPLDSRASVNPMIALGSSNTVNSDASFSGKCYSSNYVPVYDNNVYRPRTIGDIGMINYNTDTICETSKGLSFENPLILFNQ
jgi:hypothetical protein